MKYMKVIALAVSTVCSNALLAWRDGKNDSPHRVEVQRILSATDLRAQHHFRLGLASDESSSVESRGRAVVVVEYWRFTGVV